MHNLISMVDGEAYEIDHIHVDKYYYMVYIVYYNIICFVHITYYWEVLDYVLKHIDVVVLCSQDEIKEICDLYQKEKKLLSLRHSLVNWQLSVYKIWYHVA